MNNEKNGPTPEPAKTSKLAKISLALAIFSLLVCFVTIIPAIILAIISLVKIKKSQGRLKGRGFAIAGMAISITQLVILLSASFYMLSLANRLLCGENFKGLSVAMHVYTTGYDNKYPTGSQWCDLLIEHAYVDSKSFKCPGSDVGQSSYALNANALKLGPDAPGDMVLIFETSTGWNQVGGPELLTMENHRGKGCIILFVDRRIEFVKAEDIDELRWTAEQGD